MIVIRHGKKEYDNTTGLDSPLSEQGVVEATIIIKQYTTDLISCPKTIICSPYLRCRETSLILQNELYNKFNKIIPIKPNPIFGEYLGNRKTIDYNSITQETKDYYSYFKIESYKQFNSRINKIILYDNCCYVTHGLVIKLLLNNLKDKYNINFDISYPNEVTGFKIQCNEIYKL